MTKQEADFIGSMNMCDEISNEAYKKIMCNCEVEEEECEDCISRQALIEKATSWDKHFADSERYVSLTDIQGTPSVTPQPKRGKWISIDATHSKCEKCEAIFKITSPNAEVNFALAVVCC